MATVAGSKANRNPLYRFATRRWKGVSNEQSREVEKEENEQARKRTSGEGGKVEDETYSVGRWRTIGERKADESPSTLIPGFAGIATSFDIITILDKISLTMYAEAIDLSLVCFPEFPKGPKKKENKKLSELSADGN